MTVSATTEGEQLPRPISSKDASEFQSRTTSSLSSNIDDSPPRRPRSYLTHLNEPIRDDIYVELQLLVLAFSTGIQDASTYPDYLCFASNQTGNTVLLAIGLSGLVTDAFDIDNIAVSLGFFLLGAWVAGQFGNVVGPRRRIWLIVSSIIQTAMVWATAVIQYCTVYERTGLRAFLVLGLLAFSASSQVAMARGLKITEITTAMATAAYVDWLIDPRLFAKHNRGRNRRIAFLLMLAAGTFAGAYANKGISSAFALMLSAILKTVITISLFFNRPMAVEDLDSTKKEEVLMLG
jgi:uncharacterized membrane protein YoaK (UPF0700 family)